MRIDKSIYILEIERECVTRQGTDACPNRNCNLCDLCMKTEDVLEAYDTALSVLRGQRLINKVFDSDY